MSESSEIDLSVVIPGKNEANQIDSLFKRLIPILESLGLKWEILFVNDGSTDESLALLLNWRKQDSRIGAIDLSRNFGKEAALSAGLHHARGQAIISMDADGQHQPELIPDFIRYWREGYEMVITQRVGRRVEGWARYHTTAWFYRIFNMIGDINLIPDAGDFRLFDRRVVEAYKQYGERTRFNKGVFALLGFKQKIISHPSEKSSDIRPTKWGWRKLFALAFDAFFSYSRFPIRLWMMMGSIAIMASLSFLIYIIFDTLLSGRAVPGYASLLTAVVLMGGINMVGVGILGEYISRIFTETKQRPLYIVRQIHQNDV